MITAFEIEEQIRLLQQKKEEILSYSIKDAVNTQFKINFSEKILPKIENYKKLTKIAKNRAYIDAVFETILTEKIGSENTSTIMHFLIRSAERNDFSKLLSCYSKFKDNLEMRQLIKFCSALYRYKLSKDSFSEFTGNSSIYKSEMKYSTACENCGALAFEVAIQMKKLNFI